MNATRADSVLASGGGIALSVVSHNHGLLVYELVQALATCAETRLTQVIITLNIPEPLLAHKLEATHWPFTLVLIRNETVKGFGANHNAAFSHCEQQLYGVMNPDVGLRGNPFPALLEAMAQRGAGCAYPRQVDEAGALQGFAREVPTPMALWRRYFGGVAGSAAGQPVDWVTGAFLLFDQAAYAALGGFDECFFMYCEDVDICLRLQLAGYRLVPADVAVTHVARRASSGSLRHFVWHLRSLIRLWASPVMRSFFRARART